MGMGEELYDQLMTQAAIYEEELEQKIKDVQAGKMVWITKDRRELKLSDMSNSHLINAQQMLAIQLEYMASDVEKRLYQAMIEQFNIEINNRKNGKQKEKNQ